jgi:AcrR family transcriptional regulator
MGLRSDTNAIARPSGAPSRRRPRAVRHRGYQNVSIRKVAERIEVRPAAIYLYFPSKDDIFLALAEEGFRLLLGDRATSSTATDSRRWSHWIAFARFSGASTNSARTPVLALMFVDRSVPRITQRDERFTFVRDMRVIVEQIQVCIDAKVLPRLSIPQSRAGC